LYSEVWLGVGAVQGRVCFLAKFVSKLRRCDWKMKMKFDQPHKQQRNRANATLSFVVKKTHSIRTDQLERAQQPTQWHQRDESNNNTFEGEQTSTPKVQNAFFHKLKVTSRHSRPPRPSPLSHSAPTTSSNQLKGGTSHPPPTSPWGFVPVQTRPPTPPPM
jgi:hypothetical protein